MMTQDRSLNVMIGCVHRDIFATIEPILDNKIDRLYLLYYEDDSEEMDDLHIARSRIYASVRENVKRILRDKLNGLEIIDVPCNIVKIDSVVKKVYSILFKEDWNNSILVNISGASAEYAAGAVIAMTMESSLNSKREQIKNIRIVSTRLNVSNDSVNELKSYVKRKLYMDSDDPTIIDRDAVDKKLEFMNVFYSEPMPKTPDILMVYALREYRDNLKRTNDEVIGNLISKHLWTPIERESTRPNDKRELAKKRVQFRNLYLKHWEDMGWIKESPNSRNKYLVTNKGQMLIEMYCCTDQIPKEFGCY